MAEVAAVAAVAVVVVDVMEEEINTAEVATVDTEVVVVVVTVTSVTDLIVVHVRTEKTTAFADLVPSRKQAAERLIKSSRFELNVSPNQVPGAQLSLIPSYLDTLYDLKACVSWAYSTCLRSLLRRQY